MKFETSKELDEWMEDHQKKCKTRAFDGLNSVLNLFLQALWKHKQRFACVVKRKRPYILTRQAYPNW